MTASAATRRSPCDEGEVGRLERDVGAGAHGEAEVGLGKGGSVVDAVTDHRDGAALLLEAAYDGHLVLGEHAGDHLVDADPVGDGAGHGLLVAGEQHRSEAERAKPRGRPRPRCP